MIAWHPNGDNSADSAGAYPSRTAMSYKGYSATIDYDPDTEVSFGTVSNADILASFRGRTVKDLKNSFRDVVDSYLEDCRENRISVKEPRRHGPC